MAEKYNDNMQETEACFIFVDLIDSSPFSSFANKESYAKWILMFQYCFNSLAKKYFGEESFIGTVGDEGYAFIPVFKENNEITIIYKTLCFVFELKAIIKFLPYKNKIEKNLDDIGPYGLRLAAGIHYGDIMYTTEPIKTENGAWTTKIKNYVGYNINYAKRVETCSRNGVYSNVYVSRRVYDVLVSQKTILFEKRLVELKGLERIIEVFEIQSAFIFDEDMLEILDEEWRNCINDKNISSINNIKNEYWFKTYFLSYIFQRYQKSKGDLNKEHYEKEFSKKLFQDFEADDPIIIFIQAYHYQKNNDITLAIEKFKIVLEKKPELVRAKIFLIELIMKLLKQKNKPSSEVIYISNLTKELIEYYSEKLTDGEKKKLGEIKTEIDIMLSLK